MVDKAKKQLVSGAVWVTVGLGMANLITILTWRFVGENIGSNDLGKLFILQTSIQTASILAALGQGTSLIKFVAEYGNENNEKLASYIKGGIVVTLIGCFVLSAAVFSMKSYLQKSEMSGIGGHHQIFLINAAIIMATFDALSKSILMGYQKFKQISLYTLLGSVISSAVIIYFSSKFGFWGAAYGLVLGILIQFIISIALAIFILAEKNIVKMLVKAKPNFKEVVGFGVPALMAGLFHVPTIWIIQLYTAKLENGLAIVALLGVAIQWIGAITFVPQTISRILFPLLSSALESPKSARDSLVRFGLIINVLTSTALIFIISLFISEIEAFYSMVPDIRIAIWTAVLVSAMISAQVPMGNALLSLGMAWMSVVINFIWALTYIAAVLYLTTIEPIGVLQSMIIAYGVHLVLTSILYQRKFK